jgi:PAS domain S-box-containing protein
MDEKKVIVQLQEKLKELELQSQILRVQQEESLDGILVVDAEWNILSYNQRFVSMWGIPLHIIETKDDRACISTVLDKLNNPEQFLAKVEYLMAHPTQKSQEILELKDHRYFDRSSSPIIDNENKLNGRIWFFRDITDIKRAQESLRQQNQTLENLVHERTEQLEKANDRLEEQVAIRTLDLKEQKDRLQAITENVPGVVFQFYINNAGEAGVHYTSPKLYDIFGLEFIDDPQLFLQTFVQNIHEEDQQSWLESVHEVVEKQIPWKWQGRYVKPSGEIIWFEGDSIPTVRKDEIVFDGIFIDITEKIEKEVEKLEITRQHEQLKKLESLKTMAGAIAHQFNNSMMAVQGNLELMILTLPDDSSEREMAMNASKAARGASQIGSMMLSYVGQKKLQPQEVSFVDFVRESVNGLKGTLDSSISLSLSSPDQALYCSIDRFKMKEVIESILNNSVESLKGTSGNIKVTFGMDSFTTNSFPIPFQGDRPSEGMFVFCQIEDTGHGIRSEIMSQIFEPFFTTRFVGRGLGLALTVGIMRRHDGAITVESSPGKGTTVRVLLPISSTLQSTEPFFDEVEESERELSGDILLADDEPILLIVNKMMLERLGFTVHTAINGKEAVGKVRKQDVAYCAVVLDILMPGLDGIEAMKEIRKIDPTVPVLLLSGYSQNDFPFQERVDNEPDGFMEKPVQLSEMRRSLARALN